MSLEDSGTSISAFPPNFSATFKDRSSHNSPVGNFFRNSRYPDGLNCLVPSPTFENGLYCFMKPFSLLSSLLVILLLVGCSSSQTATTTAPTPPEDSASSTAESANTRPSSPDTSAERPSLPAEAPQDWYHLDRDTRRIPGLATQTAYQTILQNRTPQDTVVVAVIDSGIDTGHEDLTSTIWRNRDEIPNNESDDDGNGYVDDRHGWNFIGGPDGKNVEQDTYELTRLYVKFRKRFADVDSASVSPDERNEYQRFQTIKQRFQKNRQQAKKELSNVQQARDAVQFSEKVLSTHLGVDSLTQTAVDTFSTEDPKVSKAQNILLYFYQQGLTPQDIYDYYEHVKRKVEYNYNPDFTPRPIVGDDYSDKTQRYYGNNDVRGPDAHHGTHVGGIIGAGRNNGVGIDGIANGVRVMPIRAVPNGDERDKDVANAIRYAVENGAEVINMSFGKGYSPYKKVVDEAVQYADSMGVLMVHAAGNDGENVDSTENYPTRQYLDGGQAQNWIEVGASSWQGASNLAAPFSNYGENTVDVFAPGRSIYSTVPNDKYERNDGTSMAAPMVSGVAALIMAYYPELTTSQVRSVILETASSYQDVQVARPGGSSKVSFGQLSRTGAVVNAHAALKRAKTLSTE